MKKTTEKTDGKSDIQAEEKVTSVNGTGPEAAVHREPVARTVDVVTLEIVTLSVPGRRRNG